MSRARGVLGRLRQRVGAAKDPAPAPPEKTNGPGRTDKIPRAEREVSHLLEMVGVLSPMKQITMHERMPRPEITLDNGVKVTAFSKKELFRFTRPIDSEVLEWLGGMAPGDAFYDIGANCGSLTLATASMHGRDIRIVAIEPGYANFESLVRNLSHNGMLDFVIPLQIALMDRTGVEPINYYRSTAAGTSLHAVGEPLDHEDNQFRPVATQLVPAFTLDDLLDVLKLPAPSHMKVDVDGSEGLLLRGAGRTLAGGTVKELLIEIVDHDRAGTRLASTKALLAPHGYELANSIGHNRDDAESFVADHLFRRGG